MELCRAAKRDGVVRRIGVTSHQRPLAAEMAKSGKFGSGMRDTAFDGSVTRELRERSGSLQFHGSMTTSEPFSIIGSISSRVIMLYYRPSPDDLEQMFSGSARREALDGSPCVVLEGEGKASPVVFSIWLDTQRGYAARRWQDHFNGQVIRQTDVSYQQDPAHGWVPAAWKNVNYARTGELRRSEEATVTE